MTKSRLRCICAVQILFVSFLMGACCRYPHRALTRVCRTPVVTSISVVAYGDTRTGPWGLGDNCDQAIHAMVMDNILDTTSGIDAVLFSGDAVMTNFPLWKKRYWRAFLTQSDRLVKTAQSTGENPCIPFLPTMGNHETYVFAPARAPQNAASDAQPPHALPNSQPASQASSISEAYDRGEKSAELRGFVRSSPSIDYYSKAGKKQLLKWEKSLRKGSQREKVDAAMKLGAFEGQLQSDFFELPFAELKSKVDGQLFKEAYIDIANYRYLLPHIQTPGSDPRSFYSYTIDRDGIRVKLIALDTNCLNYSGQFDFFRSEVTGFDGPIIVFGHHPPIRLGVAGVLPWDITPGWDQYKPYIETPLGRNIRLWIFGHVHNYQRRSAAAAADAPKGQVLAPVLLISGGGGAADLNETAGSNQWQPKSWPEPIIKKQFNYARISVTKERITVDVYGKPSLDKSFSTTPIDSFFIDLK